MYKSVWKELRKSYAAKKEKSSSPVISDQKINILKPAENEKNGLLSFSDTNFLYWADVMIMNPTNSKLKIAVRAIVDTGCSSTLNLPLEALAPLNLKIGDHQFETKAVSSTGEITPIYGYRLFLEVAGQKVSCPVFFSELDKPLLGNGFLSQCHFFQLQGDFCLLSMAKP